jgi:hypothetical protein
MVVVSLWAVVAMVVLQSPTQAQTDDSPLPVSLERIRAKLEEPPPRLRVPAPSGDMATFRVEVRQSVLQPLDEKPFDLTWGLPSVGELLMGGIDKIRSAAVDYKRGRAVRRARREVQEALAAFCAVHECAAPASPK